MKKLLLGAALFVSLLLSACGAHQNTWSIVYEVVGTESTQLWDLKAEDFLTMLNAAVPEDLQLYPLHEYDPNSLSYPLTRNGETWKINLSIFPADKVDSLAYKNEKNVNEWVNNISEVELSLYANNEADAKNNGVYVRELITIFTPGAEELVEDAIGLYGEPEEEAIITEGVYRVSVDSVAYTYMPNQNSFIVQPHLEPWPETESSPSVIRPD